jgi:hypothetical protein
MEEATWETSVWGDNIKMDLKEIGRGVNGTHLAQDSVQWRVEVSFENNNELSHYMKSRDFFTNRAAVSLSGGAVCSIQSLS